MLNFKENAENGLGTLIISGFCPPHDGYDPVGKIWASVRKRIFERYRVDVVGLFTYNEEKEITTGSFCLNYSILERNGVNERVYVSRFKDTFQMQMTLFEDVIIAFIDDPIGLTAYQDLLYQGATQKQLDKGVNAFLRSINVRTEKDQRRAEKRTKNK